MEGERRLTPVLHKPVPLLDLQAQHKQIRDEVLAEMARVVDSQKFILGEDVQRLESEIATYCTAKYAVGCASGSDALVLALMALGIGPGDEVLTSPYTFFATAGAISRAGATPVFVDVEESTFNMDAARAAGLLASHRRIRAIIPVHLFGGCADMDSISAAAAQRGIPVIEDAAQSIGSEYKGRRAGSIGHIGCFSFFPSKNLGCYGDGGMLTTNDGGIAERLRALRVHGGARKYYHQWIGINSRLDTLQAAVLRIKLRYLDGWSEGRRRNADHYRAHLARLAAPVTPLSPAPYQTRHIYNQFVIRAPQRDALQEYLKQQGIGSEVYYPLPLHLQPCYSDLGYRQGDFPVSEKLAGESLALPVYSELAADDIDHICETIGSFYGERCGSARS
jgi:dTDP-4-amino-4,6-dideoxygalactose transaminase